MKNRTLFLFIILFIVSSTFHLSAEAEKKILFKELVRPGIVTVNPGETHLYIVDFPNINVYSLKDFKLIKTFGSRGEGPGEFLRFARPYFHNGSLLVHSQVKLSYYSKEWKLQKQHNLPMLFDRGFKPFGDKIAAAYMAPGEKPGIRYKVIALHDWERKKIKEVFRQEYYFASGKKINGIYLPEADRRSGVRFMVWKDRLYIEPDDGENGMLDVYDSQGEKLYTIKHQFEKLEVTSQHKKMAAEWFRVRGRHLLEIVKERGLLRWPSHFPAIRYVDVIDDKIYIIPYKQKEGKVRLFVFDLRGKLLRHVAAPFTEESIFEFHPMCIKGGKIYQVTENDDEVYELHIYDIATLPVLSR